MGREGGGRKGNPRKRSKTRATIPFQPLPPLVPAKFLFFSSSCARYIARLSAHLVTLLFSLPPHTVFLSPSLSRSLSRSDVEGKKEKRKEKKIGLGRGNARALAN